MLPLKCLGATSGRLPSHTRGHCLDHTTFRNNYGDNFRLSVPPRWCTEAPRHDFSEFHKATAISFHGAKPFLLLCVVSTWHLKPLSLFKNSPQLSRRFMPNDGEFVHSEIPRQGRNGITMISVLSWYGQVFATSRERHNRRMVIKYSQTINRYMLLDAYLIANDIWNGIYKNETHWFCALTRCTPLNRLNRTQLVRCFWSL